MPKTQITYVAGPGDPPSVTWRGQTFVHGQPVEFDDGVPQQKDIIEAAQGNPSFNVGDEDKAKNRAEAERQRNVAFANSEIARITNEGMALEARQTQEMNDLEAKHQAERDAFLNANEQTVIAHRRTVRGSDGSDDNQPEGDEHLEPSDLGLGEEGREKAGQQEAVPASPPGGNPGLPTDPNSKTQQANAQSQAEASGMKLGGPTGQTSAPPSEPAPAPAPEPAPAPQPTPGQQPG